MSFLEAHLSQNSYPAVSESFNFRIYCRGHISSSAGALSAVSGSKSHIRRENLGSGIKFSHLKHMDPGILHVYRCRGCLVILPSQLSSTEGGTGNYPINIKKKW